MPFAVGDYYLETGFLLSEKSSLKSRSIQIRCTAPIENSNIWESR